MATAAERVGNVMALEIRAREMLRTLAKQKAEGDESLGLSAGEWFDLLVAELKEEELAQEDRVRLQRIMSR